MRHTQHRILLTVVVAALLCSSCGGKRKLYPVRGQVFYMGQPAAGALVVFHPADGKDLQAPKPSGQVGADGSFTLSTFAPNDGAPAGPYKVAIVWVSGDKIDENGELPNRLPPQYANVETSGLQAEVKEGPTDLQPFQLGQ